MGRFIDVKLKPGHVPKDRLALVVFTLFAAGFVMYFGGFWGEPQLEADYGLHSVALEQVNNFRRSHDVTLLDYDADPVAQEHAWDMMGRGELYYSSDLPSGSVESIAVYSEAGVDPVVAIALILDQMVNDDAFGVDRGNVLNPGFGEVSVGVAVDGDRVWLVLVFS